MGGIMSPCYPTLKWMTLFDCESLTPVEAMTGKLSAWGLILDWYAANVDIR